MIMPQDVFDKWVASGDLPADVEKMVRAWPNTTCYRMPDTPGAHVAIVGYAENTTVRIVEGSDSPAAGISAFGIDPNRLVKCGCGAWQPPTDKQIAEAHYRFRDVFLKRN